jgi:membrane protein implicated in regulation of membrane protease activity
LEKAGTNPGSSRTYALGQISCSGRRLSWCGTCVRLVSVTKMTRYPYEGYDMKLTLTAVAILTVISLASCRPKEQAEAPREEPIQSTPQHGASAGGHTGTVQEVIQANAYTYLSVKEQDDVYWVAITKRDMKVGEKVSFAGALEMKNFTSKDLQRTFESIYFVSEISAESPASPPEMPVKPSHQGKVTAERLDVAIDPAEGGISIGELFANRESYAGKAVLIRGQVTKVNRAIMGKNWVHLQDGTSAAGNYDLTITTHDEAAPGEVVTFEGTIVLNKDFGSGYAYEILMEEARRRSE